ncbi:MAG: GTPase ObgE [Coriobacteriales bacterium]
MAGTFTDQVRIQVKSGNGGAGCTSFRREAHVPKGGPDGGDGGRGGDIIIVADATVSTLIDYRYKHHFKAAKGTHGQGKRMHGANGEDLILKVPVGTVVRLLDEDLNPCEEIADLTHNGERVIVAKGGRGGRGNTHFVTPTRRAPSFSELGEPTEPFWIELEMKLMADAALVGMPSVGKSSLIACMSAARPKIADYPFTTLTPNLGMVRYGDLSFTVADVPGLIEGAAEGKGLGHEFLRHVERTALILHVVDLTGGLEGRDPVEDYEIIKRELELYAPELADRPVIVVGNKVDVPGTEENLERLRAHVKAESEELSERLLDDGIDIANPIPFFAVSAVTQTGIDSLIAATATEVHRLREQAAEDPVPEYDQIWEHKRLERDRAIEVEQEEAHAWRVHGTGIERMVVQTEWDNDEAVAFLQRRMERAGVERALTAAGAHAGDEVRIMDIAFEFEPAGWGDEEFDNIIDREG